MAQKNTSLSNEKFSSPLVSFRNEMNDFFDRFTREIFSTGDQNNFVPKVEVKDNGNNYQVCAELPGMKEEDINVTFQDGTLILEGEKRNEQKKEGKGYYRSEISYGSFYRAIPLASDVNEESIAADYKDGVLKITMDKTPDTGSRVKKIPIKKETKH